MRHDLKILQQYYQRVADGSKTFEVRDNDRGFQPGDEVVLREWIEDKGTNGQPLGYTQSPPLTFKIGYVYVLDSHRVIFSLLPTAKKVKS